MEEKEYENNTSFFIDLRMNEIENKKTPGRRKPGVRGG
jgi:hypothetical protein